MSEPSGRGAAEALFRLCLLAFPAWFRERYRDELIRSFRARRAGSAHRRAPARGLALAAILGDTVWSGLRERIAGRASGAAGAVFSAGALSGAPTSLRLAARTLARRPLFSALSILTLAVGLGGAATVASVTHGVLLAPLPYQDAPSISMLWQNGRLSFPDMTPRLGAVAAEIMAFRDRGESHASVTWIDQVNEAATLVRESGAERVEVGRVGPGFFQFLGVRPALGALFDPHDDSSEGQVLVSHATWTGRFGADPGLVGRAVELDGRRRTVVGVLPEDFRWLYRERSVEFFIADPLEAEHRAWIYIVLARPAPGRTPEMMREEFARFVYADHTRNGGVGRVPSAEAATLVPLDEAVLGPVEGGIRVLAGFTGLVLLLACLSTSQLLLGRFSQREDELRIRTALGARPAGLALLILGESLILTGAGAGVGVLLAHWGVAAVKVASPPGVPRLEQASLTPEVLAAVALAALVVLLFMAAAPVRHAVRLGPVGAARGGRQVGDVTASGRRWLILGQVCFATVLLAVATLLLRSFDTLRDAELGFEARGVAAGAFELPLELWELEEAGGGGGDDASPARWVATDGLYARLDALEEELSAIPGVEAASLAYGVPLKGRYFGWTPFTPEGWEDRERGEEDRAVAANYVDENFFRVLGVRPLRGRTLTAEDLRPRSPPVAVVSEALARRFWPGEDAVGKRFRWLGWVEVVGVVPSLRERQYESADATVYLPFHSRFAPAARPSRQAAFLIRGADATREAGTALVAPARRAFTSVFPRVGLQGLEPLHRTVDRWLTQPRFYSYLAAVFAAYGFILALVGIAGVVAYQVSLRTREMAVRRVLGARTADVLAQLSLETVGATVAGIAAGLVLAGVGSRLLSAWLYRIGPLDPVTFTLTPALFVTAALGATWIAARRGVKVQPADALRDE